MEMASPGCVPCFKLAQSRRIGCKKKGRAVSSQSEKIRMKTAIGVGKSMAWALVFADFKELTKARLALSVVFSSLAGYLLGTQQIEPMPLVFLAFGGYCMVGASKGISMQRCSAPATGPFPPAGYRFQALWSWRWS
jgi:hypothetical protein